MLEHFCRSTGVRYREATGTTTGAWTFWLKRNAYTSCLGNFDDLVVRGFGRSFDFDFVADFLAEQGTADR